MVVFVRALPLDLADLRPLIADMSFHSIDGGAVIYDPSAKRLFALNAAAAMIWQAVKAGNGRLSIRMELASAFNLVDDEAENWIERALSSFGGTFPQDASAAALPDLPEFPKPALTAVGTNYAVLGQNVTIAAPGDALALIDTMIGSFKQGQTGRDRAALSIAIEAVNGEFAISSDGDPRAVVAPEKLVAEVERRIVQDLVPRVPHFLAFHAALLQSREGGVLFPAPSGSGKTTLSATLAREGWGYLSDEMALLERSLTWQGLPFPPCIKAENYALIEAGQPGLRDAVEHDRFGRRVKFLPLTPRTGSIAVSTVVFPEYRADAVNTLEPLAAFDGLQRFLTQCVYVPFGFTDEDVSRLLQWHDQTAYYTLRFSSAHAAVQILGQTGDFALGGRADVQ